MSETEIHHDRLASFFSSGPGLLALVLFLSAFLQTWGYGNKVAGIDFYQFRAVALWKAKSPATNVYAEASRRDIAKALHTHALRNDASTREHLAAGYREVLETYSSPFLYTLFLPFTLAEYDRSFKAYVFVMLLSIVLGIAGFCRVLRYPWWATFVALAFYCGCYRPLVSDIGVGNVNQIQLGMLGLYVWLQSRRQLRRRNFLGGFTFGFALMFKPNLVYAAMLLTGLWLVRRRFQKALEAAAGLMAACLIAFLLSYALLGFGASAWTDWLKALGNIPDEITTVQLGNYSLARFIWDMTRFDISAALAYLLCATAIVFIWRGHRDVNARAEVSDEVREDCLMIGTGCVVYLLSSQLVWFHYLVLAIPISLYLLRPASETHGTPKHLPLVCWLTAGAVILISPYPVGFRLAFQSIGLGVFFALSMRELRQNALCKCCYDDKP